MPTIVLYDPERDMACLVQEESGRTLGPVRAGPQCRELLQAFVDSTPFDIAVFDSFSLRDALTSFEELLNEEDEPGGVQEVMPDPAFHAGEVVPSEPPLAGVALDTETDVPAPQPADEDLDARTQQPVRIVECFNCAGSGSVAGAENDEPLTCGVCNGKGKLVEQVAA